MGRSLLRSFGASLINACTCAAVMSVAAMGACALAEEAMSNSTIPRTILRMKASPFCDGKRRGLYDAGRITHPRSLQLASGLSGHDVASRGDPVHEGNC